MLIVVPKCPNCNAYMEFVGPWDKDRGIWFHVCLCPKCGKITECFIQGASKKKYEKAFFNQFKSRRIAPVDYVIQQYLEGLSYDLDAMADGELKITKKELRSFAKEIRTVIKTLREGEVHEDGNVSIRKKSKVR